MSLTKFESAVKNAYEHPTDSDITQSVYRILLQSQLIMPCQEKNQIANDGTSFIPLYTIEKNNIFVPIFDEYQKFKHWAKSHKGKIPYISLSGRECIIGIIPEAYLCLNLGTDYYKEISPKEILFLKNIVSKTQNMSKSNSSS